MTGTAAIYPKHYRKGEPMIEQMPKNHLVTPVTLEGIGTVEVSTIDFNTHPYVTRSRHSETCLFWEIGEPGKYESQRSHVVATYGTWAEAEQAHEQWCQPERVAKAVLAAKRQETQP